MTVRQKAKTARRLIARMTRTPTRDDISHLTYAVNNFCNNKCVMCNIWSVYRAEPELLRRELSVADVRAAFEPSQYLRRVKHILLTGGEPILKDDFVQLYLFFAGFNPAVEIAIASNGRATSLIVRRLEAIRAGLQRLGQGDRRLQIGFSLDGFGELHDRVRGVPGLFDAVLRTIEAVRSLENTHMALSFTIGPHNYLDLPKVFDLATDLGLGLAYRCVQTSPIYYGTQRAEEGWSEEQLEELERSLRVMEQRVYAQQSSAARLVNLNRFYNEMMLEYERRPRRLHECYSGSESVFIDAYGNVFPCIIRDGSFGSVKEAPFDDIWTSEKAESTRQSIARHDCHCWVDCEVNPAISRDPRAYVRNLRHVI